MLGLERSDSAVDVRAPEVVGRSVELAAIEAVLDATDDLPVAITLAGEPGIGKSTIWEAAGAAALARGFTVLQSRPAESEAGLTFTGLGDLLADVWPTVAAELPRPQRRALGAALLVGDEDELVPDQRSVGVAVLSALRVLSQRAPLLIAVDDEQWLDLASTAVLGFALRRLRTEQICVLLSRRKGSEREHNAPRLANGLAGSRPHAGGAASIRAGTFAACPGRVAAALSAQT